jgi:UDP-glucose 4-epimerase
MMTVLVTGGAGFIGSHLVERLVREGRRVVVLDDLSTGSRDHLPHDIRLIQADIRDRQAVATAMSVERPELVIHLAGQMNVRRSLADPDLDADVNVRGSLSVFQAAFSGTARRVVFASSGGAIYGDQPSYPCDESVTPRPSSPYGISKCSAEHYGRHLADAAGRDFVALRLANVYGPRQNPAGEAGVVALFLEEMLAGRAPAIFGDGEQTRDFVWIEDVVETFVRSIDGPPGVFNVGTGQETRVSDLYRELARAVGFPHPARWSAALFGEVRRNALSVRLACKRLGWAPRTGLREGLERTVRCWRRRVTTTTAEVLSTREDRS